MRFRAKAGSEQFQFLADVVQHLHRLSASMLLKLGPTAINLACNEHQSGTGDGLPVFAKLSPADLFFEYRLEARANNHILVSLKPAHLLRAARALRKFFCPGPAESGLLLCVLYLLWGIYLWLRFLL
jgi:hypothetical protein